MFDREAPAPSRAETIDSIAECANIVGGLVKGELKTHYAMGLPLAFAGDGSFLEILYSNKVAEFCYVCFNAPMRITIYGSI
ncbi:MAG: chemotaxis protein CheX [Kangiellaceae bacterium]|nr:chemotaxis protein CheX [Kangiellaceae bacterium]